MSAQNQPFCPTVRGLWVITVPDFWIFAHFNLSPLHISSSPSTPLPPIPLHIRVWIVCDCSFRYHLDFCILFLTLGFSQNITKKKKKQAHKILASSKSLLLSQANLAEIFFVFPPSFEFWCLQREVHVISSPFSPPPHFFSFRFSFLGYGRSRPAPGRALLDGRR